MSNAIKAEAEKAYPVLRCKPSSVIPHGHYRDVYPSDLAPEEARRRLGYGAGDMVVLFFGAVRRNKNVLQLVAAFRKLPDDHLRLVIAGSCKDEALRREITERAGEDRRIVLRLEFIPESEAQLYYRSANLVVLPFASVTNSGSALLAVSFGVPTLVPDLGSMSELADCVGADWISMYTGRFDEDVLKAGLVWAESTVRSESPRLELLEWRAIAERTATFYEEVLR